MQKPRLQDDFYTHVNYSWLKSAKIDADAVSNSSFFQLQKKTTNDLKKILQNIKPNNHNKSLIYDLYSSFMDTKRISQAGTDVLNNDIKLIDDSNTKDELLKNIGILHKKGYPAHIGLGIAKHPNNGNKHIMFFEQAGLSLPDEDFYKNSRYKNIRAEYKKYIEKLLFSFDKNYKNYGNKIFEIESSIAKYHMDVVSSRDVEKIVNIQSFNKLKQTTSKFNWISFFDGFELNWSKLKTINVSSPKFYNGLNTVWENFSLEDWKKYYIFKIIDSMTSYLPKKFETLSFDFYGKILSGQLKQKPRWKKAIGLINSSIPHALGYEYIKEYFPKSAKKDVLKIVEYLKKAYYNSINNLNWMEDSTKKHALKKLDKMVVKIGYPDFWKSYKKLKLQKNSLYNNIVEIAKFDTEYELKKLDKKPDGKEWHMGAQIVNAYFNPEDNEIVFPAAILQKPFFSVDQSIEKNYGGIGTVIGHEIGHCFDDQGSKFDADGKVKNWWTKKDRSKFNQMTKILIDQYNSYSPAQLSDKHKVNGALTIGENIGDIGGLEIGIKAYKLMNKHWTNHDIKEIFFALANCEKSIIKDEILKIYLSTDPHSPAEFRINGVVKNIEIFYEIFNVKKSDKMYIVPEKRVSIWN